MKRVAQPATGITIALIYTRVSSDDQAREGVSLAAQLAECRRYAASKRWMIGAEYQDVMTGRRDDRPQYQALLAEIRRLRAAGIAVVVLVAVLDRLGRKLLERVRSREELKALGVAVHSVREGGEVNDVVAGVMAVLAEEESRRNGERIRASRSHIVSKGWLPGGRAPWGYRWRAATAEERRAGAPKCVLESDPETAAYARELFERVARGESIRSVANWLAGLPSAARGERRLKRVNLPKLLRCPVYVARQERRKGRDVLETRPQRWPPLIDDATWRSVQEHLDSHVRMPHQAVGRFLLTGFARCPRCGGRLTGQTPSGRQTVHYRCSNPTKGCNKTVPAGLLDGLVTGRVVAALAVITSDDPSIRREWARLQQPAVSDAGTQRARLLEQGAERARQRITRGTEMYVDGDLDRPAYEALCEKARADLSAIDAELARLSEAVLPRALPPVEEVLRQAGGWGDTFRGADTPAKRQVLAVLIDRIDLEQIGRGKYDARITWTSLGEALRQVAARLSGDVAA